MRYKARFGSMFILQRQHKMKNQSKLGVTDNSLLLKIVFQFPNIIYI